MECILAESGVFARFCGELQEVFRHQFTLGVEHLHIELLFLLLIARISHAEVEMHRRIFVVLAETRGDVVVKHVSCRHVEEINITEDARHAEHILTFQVRTIAPAEHLHRKTVFTFAEIRCQIIFAHIVSSLTVAHKVAIHPNHCGTIYASKVNDSALFRPSLGKVEGAHIRTHGVDAIVCTAIVVSRTRHDVRWRVGVGIFHIAVDRMVISLHLPVRRHRDVVPF